MCMASAWKVHGRCMANAWGVHGQSTGQRRGLVGAEGMGGCTDWACRLWGPGACSLMAPRADGGRGDSLVAFGGAPGRWFKGWCLGAALPLHTCETLCERPRGMSFICAVIGVHVRQGSPHAE